MADTIAGRAVVNNPSMLHVSRWTDHCPIIPNAVGCDCGHTHRRQGTARSQCVPKRGDQYLTANRPVVNEPCAAHCGPMRSRWAERDARGQRAGIGSCDHMRPVL